MVNKSSFVKMGEKFVRDGNVVGFGFAQNGWGGGLPCAGLA